MGTRWGYFSGKVPPDPLKSFPSEKETEFEIHFMKRLLFLLFFAAIWCVSCSAETESVPSLETEETLEAGTTYFGEIDEPEPEPAEPAPEPVTLMAEYDYGEVRKGYEGDFNDDVTIELTITAEFEKREYRSGDEFEIHIVVENTGDAFRYLNDYSEPSGTFQYRCDTEKGYTTYRISPHFVERPLPDAEPSDELAETGHLWGARYTYMIPEIIPKENFDLYINFRGYQAVIRDAIEIIE